MANEKTTQKQVKAWQPNANQKLFLETAKAKIEAAGGTVEVI